MLRGACNVPVIFQALTKEIFHVCIDEFVVLWISDLMILSMDMETHHKRLEVVLEWLRDNQLYESPGKYQFFRKGINFLGVPIN